MRIARGSIPLRIGAQLALAAWITIVGAPVAGGEEPLAPKLTPKLQDLLRQEMLSVQQASQDILLALVSGDDARVAERAQKIHDSFILQQSMTPEDRAHLMAVAPEDFVTRDRAFHGLSAELATAARAGDRPAQRERFRRMIDSCVECHERYATDRFPEFAP
ncbi:cytochrome c [Myxococcota bacterium]|nr:cytochrome c [Myxococcota bacterium]MCZ7620372.1 cytochrome c [Myxococcota bacterium]